MANTPLRPSARRSTAPMTTTAATVAGGRKGPTAEELDALRNLPAVEDGDAVDLDPANASAGKLTDETVTIVAARYRIQDWKRKDGTYPENSQPEVQLEVSFQREGIERPYAQSYNFGRVTNFAVSADGTRPVVRASAKRKAQDGTLIVPKPRKFDPAVMFINSLKVAGLSADKINKEGTKSFIGLTVHVREQRVDGMHANAKDVLLVDFIEGIAGGGTGGSNTTTTTTAAPASRSKKTEAAPAPQAQAAAASAEGTSSAVADLATQALTEVLNGLPGKTIARAQIPTTLIKIDAWKNHTQRGDILKALRSEDFLNSQADVLWSLSTNDGGEITSVTLL